MRLSECCDIAVKSEEEDNSPLKVHSTDSVGNSEWLAASRLHREVTGTEQSTDFALSSVALCTEMHLADKHKLTRLL